MKISKLIAKLEKIKEKYGDIEVKHARYDFYKRIYLKSCLNDFNVNNAKTNPILTIQRTL